MSGSSSAQPHLLDPLDIAQLNHLFVRRDGVERRRNFRIARFAGMALAKKCMATCVLEFGVAAAGPQSRPVGWLAAWPSVAPV